MSALIIAKHISHRYGKTLALDDVNLSLTAGKSIAFIGPDGVGKSTLLGLIAGAKKIQDGELTIFDGNARLKPVQRMLQQRVAYMAQGLGRNLYPELSVRENLEFFGRLYGHDKAERDRRIAELLAATGMSPFIDRPAGKLSGGMKQKLGLCCSLIHDPELLILDEPTTGVDPLSRKQFWILIDSIKKDRKNLTVLVATSYMEEAEQFDEVIMMDDGKIIAQGTSQHLKEQCKVTELEAAFIAFLPEEKRTGHKEIEIPKRNLSGKDIAIEATNLTRRFGSFTAVDHVNFKIPTGEIFGFLGSNGCGKSTTMKMMTGLLPVSEGESFLFGKKLVPGDMQNRWRIGYMSQAFSLYGELTVDQNLQLHIKLFGLSGDKAENRLKWLYDTFDLISYKEMNSGSLPLGVRQRLSLAVAVIHEPEILILDEPTSGVDPVARDNFWSLLIDLSYNHNVTIFITTHFMNEAARCDRVSLMHAGKVIAMGPPDELRKQKKAETLDEAFVSYLEDASEDHATKPEVTTTVQETPQKSSEPTTQPQAASRFSFMRMFSYLLRELLEMRRDPIRLSIATLGTSLLMLVFGFGITMDVNNVRYGILDWGHSPESREYAEEFMGSTYFSEQPPLTSQSDLAKQMLYGNVSLAVEIPPDFGRELERGDRPEISATIDGSVPFLAETMGGYMQQVHKRFINHYHLAPPSPVTVESRYIYNQAFESVNAIVPGVMGLLLIFIPAILSALSVVREKEMGSIANLYVTPVTRLEFILGKQFPYILFALISFVLMFLIATLVFEVPFKGSFIGLCVGVIIYVITTTSLGLLISSFTQSQAAALFGTAMLTMLPVTQFSGLLRPVATLNGLAYWIGTFYPTTYFLKISVGSFTKGLDFHSLIPFIIQLALFIPALLLLNVSFLNKQEK
jgi:ribosome-dependent ATPase